MALKDFWKITIVLPLDEGNHENVSLLPSEAARNCNVLPEIIELIKKSDPIGRTGNYIGIYGLFLRAGGYTPTAEAEPVKGAAGKDEEGLCYDVVTYADKSVTANELGFSVIRWL